MIKYFRLKCAVLLAAVFTSPNLLGQDFDVYAKLFELSDVIFAEIEAPDGYQSAYELRIKQALDHKHPEKGHFYQRAWLSHKDVNGPTVMITNGYGAAGNRVSEIAQYLGANQISIEHRYFLESCPDSLDYDYLNFEQITADLHKINQLFRQIYAGNWIASGISKGGTTTIFYRYFYPDDVDVSVPYVAPINLSKEDTRIYDFFDRIGSRECKADIENFQKTLLENAEDFKEKLHWYYKGKNLTFSYLTFDEAFEYAVLEYPFSFWQYGQDCQSIPDDTSTENELINHFIDVVGLDLFSDRDMQTYSSHYYQAGTEMGYYGYEIEKFKNLIHFLPTDKNPSAVFMPNKMVRPFADELTKKVFNWSLTAERMVYINGALDTWSATAVPANDTINSLYFFMKNRDHSDARIRNMDKEELELLKRKLDEWLLPTTTPGNSDH